MELQVYSRWIILCREQGILTIKKHDERRIEYVVNFRNEGKR